MPEFNFDTKPVATEWIVEPLIPKGHLGVILAQAGVGKSLLVESLAVSIVYGVPFCDFETVEGDVLLIDQDTPQNVLENRLLQFARALGTKPKHNLFLESMKGLSLSDGTLIALIKDYPDVRLVIIDCLHSVCGRLNPNHTSDMSRWARVKEQCLNGQNTILLNHHISQKHELTVDKLMAGETNYLAMGNSAIIQQADTYYVVGARAVKGRTDRIYLRPVSKRVSIGTNPIILRVTESEDKLGQYIDYDGIYELGLGDVEYDVISLFREQGVGYEKTVKETYEAMGHKHGEKVTREALAKLEHKGILHLSRHRSNLFKYKLRKTYENV